MKVLVDSSLAEVSVSEESEVVLCSLVFIRQRLLLSSDDTSKQINSSYLAKVS